MIKLMQPRNCYGDVITGYPVLRDSSCGRVDINTGEPFPYWKEEDSDVDGDGFDKSYNNGNYRVRIKLDKGTLLCRYGKEYGYFTTLKGTPFEKLSLPYTKESLEYNEYEVIADGVYVECYVEKGIAAPMFSCCGGAVQYKHYCTILEEVNKRRTLRRIPYEERN